MESPTEPMYGDVFEALDEEAGVDFVVVGGFAVVAHGHTRLTVDADLVIDLAPAAAHSAVSALTAIGLRPRLPVDALDFADADVRQVWIDERGWRSSPSTTRRIHSGRSMSSPPPPSLGTTSWPMRSWSASVAVGSGSPRSTTWSP